MVEPSPCVDARNAPKMIAVQTVEIEIGIEPGQRIDQRKTGHREAQRAGIHDLMTVQANHVGVAGNARGISAAKRRGNRRANRQRDFIVTHVGMDVNRMTNAARCPIDLDLHPGTGGDRHHILQIQASAVALRFYRRVGPHQVDFHPIIAGQRRSDPLPWMNGS